MMSMVILAVFIAALLLSSLFWYWYFRRREKQLLDRLQQMVDRAARQRWVPEPIEGEGEAYDSGKNEMPETEIAQAVQGMEEKEMAQAVQGMEEREMARAVQGMEKRGMVRAVQGKVKKRQSGQSKIERKMGWMMQGESGSKMDRTVQDEIKKETDVMVQSMADSRREEQQNGFIRQEISESRYSLLENSMKRYLDESMLTGADQQRQKAMIQELISDIAHQTLTPVSNLKLYAELLEEKLAGLPSGAPDELETIREQTEKLDFLIRSLVKLSRMENGIISVQPKKTRVADLIDAIRQEYAARAGEKRIVLSVPEIGARQKNGTCYEEIRAVFDLKWTSEAVGNLVGNAVKYTPVEGRIDITVDLYSFFVRIDVADSGIGIDKSEINRIFTRFYRSPQVSDQPGVGIGLYLAREIIQAQKGYMKVSSQPGKGSVFSVFLPVN